MWGRLRARRKCQAGEQDGWRNAAGSRTKINKNKTKGAKMNARERENEGLRAAARQIVQRAPHGRAPAANRPKYALAAATTQGKTPARCARARVSPCSTGELRLGDGGVAVPAYRRSPGAIATGKHPGEEHHRVGAGASGRRQAARRHGGVVAPSEGRGAEALVIKSCARDRKDSRRRAPCRRSAPRAATNK